MAKRKGFKFKNVTAVILTIIFVMGTVGVIIPLTDEFNNVLSDAFLSEPDNTPNDAPPGGNTTPGTGDNTGVFEEELTSIESFIGPLEFGDDTDEDYNSDYTVPDEYLIRLPFISYDGRLIYPD